MKRIICFLLIYWSTPVWAQEAKKYSLFNPVPAGKLRGLNTDRPDITESPVSVDAGHFQIETDLFKRTMNKTGGQTTVENSYNLANLKLGITNRMDVQLVAGTYLSSYVKDGNGQKTSTAAGFGDLTFRVKYNLWGNNEGKTALAIMPYVNFPTSKFNSSVEAGIILPFSIDLGMK